jgi:hypothetical protein
VNTHAGVTLNSDGQTDKPRVLLSGVPAIAQIPY